MTVSELLSKETLFASEITHKRTHSLHVYVNLHKKQNAINRRHTLKITTADNRYGYR